mmetsp:Transcript_5841/g.9397  ORF Transcript_5841/g.9397 Transcript_5841/m.9397 type:complete len:662 (+) Transcript_5841:86-2071(+)|eukprot:CAMPEP_0194580700 /NCGR_PEP_ID=MMETSP0292-20121207/14386_1 /TAXON_ID=39354 /ORGANISM="Heterosigma akashiwo, Strain CCMP2393" /LENGTH=661 /DNA_ID=CAMNT_0039434153 /DNA_START=153 /DNA_END=2138 /DNA_ORIENTATION=-
MIKALSLHRHGQTCRRVLASINGLPMGVDSGSIARTLPEAFQRTSNSTQNFQARFKSTTAALGDVAEDSKKSKVDKKKPFMLDLGIPSLVPEWKKMFSADTLLTDVSAGLTVGCIAVPLSLAIAVASGVPAEVGLVTAAVSGVAGGLLGGTTLAVTGPAAAISLLVVGAVQQHGLAALPFITMACGGLQLASGVTRLGVFAKLVPVSVIAGFTTGVGSLILTGQIPKALGLSTPAGLNPAEVLAFVADNLSAVNPSSAALALGTSAAMMLLPKLHPKIPAALLAVGGATAATHGFGLDVSLIGQIPSGLEAFQFGIPMLPSVDSLPSLAATTLLIYSMTSVESLLSCAALEKMKKTSYKHCPDQELIGQGLANMGSAFFMGMPVTSVIARSGLNVRSNAATRLPALIQAGFVFGSVVFFSDSIALIPMPALSGMLITTGMGMLNPAEFKHCYEVQKIDAVPFAATIGGMLSFGLAEGIGIGCATALALNFRNWNPVAKTTTSMMEAVEAPEVFYKMAEIQKASKPSEAASSRLQTHQVQMYHTSCGQGLEMDRSKSAIWQLNGPINFLSMFEIDDLARSIQDRLAAEEGPLDAVVLDMHGVTSLEFTGVEELVNRLAAVADVSGAAIRMVNCSDAVQKAFDQCDPAQQIPRFSVLSAAAPV